MDTVGLERVFDAKKKQVQNFIEHWEGISHELAQRFGQERTSIHHQLNALNAASRKAYQNLIKKIESPTICIATTGTTSSGKSTVANLLCGHEIMPVAVEEMSAGVVAINHNPDKRILRILNTSGALWECGEWQDLSDFDIRGRLTDVMIIYNSKRNTPEEPVCPQIELEFPIRIGLSQEYAGIPKGFNFQVMDLPGLKFIGDNGNMNVIRKCRKALCLVIYNSEETDPNKQETLLQEVVSQIKELGGSPARMLFVLNRIDAFRRDESWEDREREFVNRTKGKIKEAISNALPEYEEDIKNLNVIKLSSMPAFLSLRLTENDKSEEKQAAACKIDKDFGRLIPNEILDELPRKVAQWKEQDVKRVSEAVWESSYGLAFQKSLKEHVEKHIPELVLPQIIDDFKTEIISSDAGNQNCVLWTIQTLQAEINSSEEKYQAECKRLEQIKLELEEKRKINAEALLKPFDKIKGIMKKASDKDWANEIREILKDISKTINTEPLYMWRDIIGQTASDFLQEIAESLDEGKSVKGNIFESLPGSQRMVLSSVCNELARLEYNKKQGEYIKTKDENEKEQLKWLNQALNNLADSLADAISVVISRIADQEKNRIYNMFNELLKTYLSNTWGDAQKVAPNLGFGTPPVLTLDIADSDLNFDYKFKAGFDLKTKEENEKVNTIREWMGKKKIKIGEQRIWWTLWLVKEDIFEEVDEYNVKDIYEKRSYDLADIPKVEILLTNWLGQLRSNEHQVTNKFTGWQIEQINKLINRVEEAQQELMENYKLKLDDAHKNARVEHEEKEVRFSAVYETAKGLEQDFISLINVLK